MARSSALHLRIASFCAAIYLILTLCIAFRAPLLKWDQQAADLQEQIKNELVLKFAADLGALGSTMVVIFGSVITCMVLILVRRRREALQFVVAVGGSGCITGLTKLLTSRPRPEGMQESLGFYSTSFPSGHTLSATAMYLTIALIAANYLTNPRRRDRRILVAIAFVLSILVATARMVSSTHYPSDVLAGLAAGTGWAFFVAGFSARR